MDYVQMFQSYGNQYVDSIKIAREKGIGDFEWNLKRPKIVKERAAEIAAHLAMQAKNIIEKAKLAKYENIEELVNECKQVIINLIVVFGDRNR
jgi:hypothetical protein